MARPQTFSKKENEKKKQARRLEKQNRKEERKNKEILETYDKYRTGRESAAI